MKKRMVLILFLLGIVTMNVMAQSVPANLQAALFKKIFAFDKTLAAKGNFEVAVIGANSDEIVAAFKEVGINAKAADQLPATAAVVYVMAGATPPKAQTAAKGVLSISGISTFVDDGKVSIGLGIEGGKPKILINMGQIKAEKQELSPDLLKISRIVQ